MRNPRRPLDPTELSYLLEARIREQSSLQASLADVVATAPQADASRLADLYSAQLLPARMRRSM